MCIGFQAYMEARIDTLKNDKSLCGRLCSLFMFGLSRTLGSTREGTPGQVMMPSRRDTELEEGAQLVRSLKYPKPLRLMINLLSR